MTDDANHGFARALVDEFARAGIRIAAVAPGSRSTPLALALARDPRIAVHVVLDERSAAFFALGAARSSGRPAVVLCTSGTAAANLHPGVLEAWHSRVPLVVCTADRPPELRDTGAGQATDQIKLFGSSVRWFCEVGAPDATTAGDPESGARYWRSIAARAAATASGPPSGPVHLNLAFRDPLVSGEPEKDKAEDGDLEALVARLGQGGRADGRPWVTSSPSRRLPAADDVERLVATARTARRGLIVAGWGAAVDAEIVARFSALTGWPVLADPLSGARSGPSAVSTYDAVLRIDALAEDLRPDFVLHLGAPLTGKVATAWLGRVRRRTLVDPDDAWLDPHRSATDRVAADPKALLQAATYRLEGESGPDPKMPDADAWRDRWLAVEHGARRVIDDLLDSWEEPFEGRVARDLVDCLPHGSTLVVGSSMPVRDVEAFARPREGVRFISNRGVNGIDGFTSTALGVAATSSPGPVVSLCGDLSFLHDVGGLLGASERNLGLTLVMVDNNGGGIFSFLPQAGLPEHFESLFGTPHHLDLAAVAAAYSVPARVVDRAGELGPAVTAAMADGGVQIVVVRVPDRSVNVARHRQVTAAVAAALDPRAGMGGSRGET